MQLISDHMIKHHRHCDQAFARAEDKAAARDWTGLEREAGTFLHEIERHIELEENLLFPAFEERTGMTQGPTAVMRMEHTQMRAMFEQMRSAIKAKDADRYLGITQTLHSLLQQHNAKEESMMYPMLDRSLGDDALSMVDQLETLAV